MIEIRPADPSDAYEITALEYKTFKTPLSAWFNWKERVNFLEGVNGIHETLLDPNSKDFVACREDGSIVGFATYYDGGRELQKRSSWLCQLEANLYSWQQYFANFKTYVQNRATYLEMKRRYAVFERVKEAHKKQFDHSQELDLYIYLSILAVDPDCQGEGLGTRLIQLCIDDAQDRGLPLVLKSTPAGWDFYMHKEFKEIGEPIVIKDGDKVITTFPNVILYPKPVSHQVS